MSDLVPDITGKTENYSFPAHKKFTMQWILFNTVYKFYNILKVLFKKDVNNSNKLIFIELL